MSRSVCETLPSFLVMDVLEKATALEQKGIDVIHLEIGQPDFPTPECVKEAALQAIQDNKTTYTHSLGMLPLREAIADYYHEHYGQNVSPERIVVTNGSSPAMLVLFSLLCDAGDSILMPTPTYACYENFVRFAGAEPIRVAADEKDGFQLSPAVVRKEMQPNTTGILVNSPSNPAGSLVSRETMSELASLGKMIISDEIYHGLVYEGKAVSALEVTEECCVLDGFSKRYSMTGWRLGWMVLPERFMPAIQSMMQNFFISANSISQWAGIAALKHAWSDVEKMRHEYNRRRTLMIDGLRRLGFGIKYNPHGAFYILADARNLTPPGSMPDSLSLAFDILEKAHVGVAPGIDFGDEAEGYLRFSYASSVENIEEALFRLERYIAQL